MSDVEMRNKLFEIILEIDRLSVEKDYDGLRMLHYNNCNWLQSVGLSEDYYDYLFENEIKPRISMSDVIERLKERIKKNKM